MPSTPTLGLWQDIACVLDNIFPQKSTLYLKNKPKKNIPPTLQPEKEELPGEQTMCSTRRVLQYKSGRGYLLLGVAINFCGCGKESIAVKSGHGQLTIGHA